MSLNLRIDNYWPWVLFSVPFAAVLFGIVMISTALYFPDDVVIDEYYKDGMAINQRLHKDELARTMGVVAELVSADDELVVRLTGVTDSAIRLNLFHITSADQDRHFFLLPEETAGVYKASLQDWQGFGEAGVWYIEFLGQDDKWRVRGRIETPTNYFRLDANE